MLALMNASIKLLTELKRSGTVADIVKDITPFEKFFEVLGLADVQALEERYGVDERKRVRFEP